MRTRGVAFGPGVGVAYATTSRSMLRNSGAADASPLMRSAVAQQIETAFRFLQLIPCSRFLQNHAENIVARRITTVRLA